MKALGSAAAVALDIVVYGLRGVGKAMTVRIVMLAVLWGLNGEHGVGAGRRGRDCLRKAPEKRGGESRGHRSRYVDGVRARSGARFATDAPRTVSRTW
jgi:hypothetical protein